jgi:DNA-binding MarR family transcriptional regulator
VVRQHLGSRRKHHELPSSTTTRVLDRLESKGLIRREPDPGDRRKTWVHAVPLDNPEIGAAYEAILEQMAQVHAGFTVAELTIVTRYLEAIKNVR